MLLALSTRLQNQRAEQAFQLAQQEIDAIRVEAERGEDYATFLASYPLTTATNIADTEAPETVAVTLDSTDITVARAVDIDDDSEDVDPEDEEFAVQVFRTASVNSSDGDLVAFRVGVRVYDNAALQRNTGSMLTEVASLTMTSSEGQRSQRPLAVLYTDIIQSDQDLSLCGYRVYASPTGTDPATINSGLDCD